MALINVSLSGGWRVSSTSNLITKTFSATTPLALAMGSLSTFLTQEIILGTTQSEFVFSFATLSAPQLIFATATNEVRVNFAGQASVVKFKDAFLLMDTSGFLPSAYHFGNSGTDSATITVLLAQ